MRKADTSHLEKQAIGASSLVIILFAIQFALSRSEMSIDDILFGLIVCGIALVGVWFRSEYALLREFRAAQRRSDGMLRPRPPS